MFQFPLAALSVTTRFIRYNPLGTSTMHYGMDFGCAIGTPVFAANDGNIVLSAFDSGGGNMIGIFGKNEGSRYAHLSKRLVSVGDAVSRGQLIGYSGNTGSATTGPHLHFETWVTPDGYKYSFNDRPKYAVDPMAVCHLLAGQTFKNNGLATMKPIPYPEPQMTIKKVEGNMTVSQGDVRVRTLPEATEYQYLVGGNNRTMASFGDFFDLGKYAITYTSENDGYKWGLVATPRGQFWVAEIVGKTKLDVSGEVEPEPEEKTIGDPVEQNTAVDQVYPREGAHMHKRPEQPKVGSDTDLGVATVGYYNVLETKDMTHEGSNGKVWRKVAPDQWMYDCDFCEGNPMDDKDKRIAELEAQIAELKDENTDLVFSVARKDEALAVIKGIAIEAIEK